MATEPAVSTATPSGEPSTAAAPDLWDPGYWWAQVSAYFTVEMLLSTLAFVGILIAATILGKLVGRGVGLGLDRLLSKPNLLLRAFLVTWSRRTIFIFGVLTALQNTSIEIMPLIAGLGVAGLVVGLAMQSTLANFIHGIMLMIYQPFDVGDVVDVKGVIGTVSVMTMVNTVLDTPDNRKVTIPNSDIWTSTIINLTRNPKRRLDMNLGVSYAADLDQTLSLIRELVQAHPKVLADPPPVVEVLNWGDSSINLVCRPWVTPADYWPVNFELQRRIKQLLDANDIEIPFPQRTLHIAQGSVQALATALKPPAEADEALAAGAKG